MAHQPDDPEPYGRFARRVVRAYGRRVGHNDPAGLPGLLALHDVVDEAIRDAVAGLRASGSSWGEIGAAAGISRQAAYQRWAASTAR